MRCFALLLVLTFSAPPLALAQNDSNSTPDPISSAGELPGAVRFEFGVTRQGKAITALITADDLDLHTKKTRITIVDSAGVDSGESRALHAMHWFHASPEAAHLRDKFALSAVPWTPPDVADRFVSGFPPVGDYYRSATAVEEQYLWRWLGMHAADLVVVAAQGNEAATLVPASEWPALQGIPDAKPLPAGYDLATQLVNGKACGVGAIPAVRIEGSREALVERLRGIMQSGYRGPSPARLELQRRLDRMPIEAAEELAEHYGHELKSVAYIPAVALIGRLRLGELTDAPAHRSAVQKIVAPYVDGDQPSLPDNPSGSHLSGHLIFGELARRTGDPRYTRLARQAADLGFDDDGNPLQAMPFHSDMSDAVFMGCPILVQTGRLTGEAKYYDMALRHFRFMTKLCLRDDHLYRHSPLDETAWGRGNGFPALGLALCLSDLPPEHEAHAKMLASFRAHMSALAAKQDITGMWHQVIDHEGSYRELTATCMIAFAMLRGMRSGWLDRETYAPRADRAWQAILARIGSDGHLVDVCTGTGKQRSLRDYLDRTAILGPDDRGGAMALLAATEMAAYRNEIPHRAAQNE